MFSADHHFKMLTTYYLCFNCSKFPKKISRVGKIRKCHVKHGETRAENWHMKDARHETRGARKAREHVRYESTKSTRHMSHEARETQEYARYEAREAREYTRHKACEAQEHLGNVI